MAKKSAVAKQRRRAEIAKRNWEKRQELRKVLKDQNASFEQKEDASMRLTQMPRDACPVRLRNRCQLTGRPRGYLRKFGISRICFREMASTGLIPGVVKASW